MGGRQSKWVDSGLQLFLRPRCTFLERVIPITLFFCTFNLLAAFLDVEREQKPQTNRNIAKYALWHMKKKVFYIYLVDVLS